MRGRERERGERGALRQQVDARSDARISALGGDGHASRSLAPRVGADLQLKRPGSQRDRRVRAH